MNLNITEIQKVYFFFFHYFSPFCSLTNPGCGWF